MRAQRLRRWASIGAVLEKPGDARLACVIQYHCNFGHSFVYCNMDKTRRM